MRHETLQAGGTGIDRLKGKGIAEWPSAWRNARKKEFKPEMEGRRFATRLGAYGHKRMPAALDRQ